MLNENDRWLLSYYRTSEIQGALFFGRLARLIRDERVQADMTAQFADEARHADLFTRCLHECGTSALALPRAYQDAYLEAAGIPANLVDVLALTHVFERRVMRCYAEHLRRDDALPAVRATLRAIMTDERQHVRWTHDALERLRSVHGAAAVDESLARHVRADGEVHDAARLEWQQRCERRAS
jgi:rubrerythrin